MSALIVNYDSGVYALALAHSLVAQWSLLGRHREDLEVVVVDNASPIVPSRELAALETLGARVVRADSNLGYAAGMNLALASARGARSDFVLVLNPDLALFPGALGRMLDAAQRRERLGALGPRAFLDPARTWRMPPNRLPTPDEERSRVRARGDATLARRLSDERTTHALREWTANEPLEVEMLSGACLLLPRAAIDAAGGLFDARYPLYFEDTDLFRRLANAGLELVLEPAAEIVHHWARSSGIERGDGEPARRYAISKAAYFARWFDADERAGLADEGSGEASVATGAEPRSLGPCETPPLLEFPRAGRWLVELAMSPDFPLAAGTFVEGRSWRMPERAWEWFYRGRYFARAVDPADRSEAAAWTFDKPTLARARPLAPEELLADDRRSP